MKQIELKGRKVLVMGLGLHGGGVETARYLAGKGALVTCTDLRSEVELKPSIRALDGLDIKYVLGRHRIEDFDGADMIVKNPAVPANSSWLTGRKNIETDISLFLRDSKSPLLAVTGSKGKSTTVSALHFILKKRYPGARLGGNITVSPLSFVDDINENDPVILELSSWQLADLQGRNILCPHVAAITNLMNDHQNRYDSFKDYEADKTVIFESLNSEDFSFFPDDDFGRHWSAESPGTTYLIRNTPPEGSSFRGAYLDESGAGWIRRDGENETGKEEMIVPAHLSVPGEPFRMNMLFAAAMACLWGCKAKLIREALSEFPGVPYRMELFLEADGIKYYDDTAATIPDAAAAAVKAIDRPLVLIAGGTDKELDFAPFDEVAGIPRKIIMLKGSATDTWLPRLRTAGIAAEGPYDGMNDAVEAAVKAARPGDAVVLSPGAASFGMFVHEFQRGDVFKAACRKKIKLNLKLLSSASKVLRKET